MPDLFLSYSRDDSLAMEVIRDNLRKLGFNLWVDIEHLAPGTPQWERAVKHAVRNTDAMIVLCSASSEQSEWVNREVHIGRLADKPIIPILIRGEDLLDTIPASLIGDQYVDMRGRSDPAEGFNELVAWLAEHFGLDMPDYQFETDIGQVPAIQVINVHGHVEGHVVAIGQDVRGDVNIAGENIRQTTPAPSSEPAQKPTPVRARRGLSWIWMVGIGAATVIVIIGLVTLLGGGGPTSPIAEEPVQTEAITAGEGAAEPTAAFTDEPTLIPPTAIPEPTQNPVLTLAEAGVSSNDEWEPYFQEFDGVQMALVPAGCFVMGSEAGDDDEKPTHEVCFDKPFWIDVYEVTNGQYGSASQDCINQSSEDDQPHICIDWFESAAHCESRGARLPTEAEWEYAARGPDGLIYPWGNDFVADNVVYSDNSSDGTAPVGSRSRGISWVGAYDLSGNVWEWVSSLRLGYPYDLDDGREIDGNNDNSNPRVLRGGSWDVGAYYARAANRDGDAPGSVGDYLGFRCVLPYQNAP